MFGEPEWKTVPWYEIPKTPKDMLLDVYVEIPWLFETFDKIRKGVWGDSRGEVVQHLVCKCWQIRHELRSWYVTTGSNIEYLVREVTGEGDSTASLEHMANAQLLVLYWCCLLHYSQLWHEIFESEQGMLAQIPPVEEDTQTTCRIILGVIAMFLKPSSGWFGINIAAFPLFVIFNHIQGLEWSIGVTWQEREILYELLQTPKGKVLYMFFQSLKGICVCPF